MDHPAGFRHRKSSQQAQGHHRRPQRTKGHDGPTPLFDDTSNMGPGQPGPGGTFQGQGSYGQPQQQQEMMFPGQQIMNDPMANMAMQYGASLADHGKDVMEKQIDRFMSLSKLKYYFAVDTTYVAKKLAILLCPFTHTEWTIGYNQQDEPVAPRYEVNAPDLYIPVMGFVTYILLAGVALGRQDKFSPEQLGIQASTALVWLIIEIVAVLLTLYIMNIHTALRKLDLVAFCGYKYVGMIVCVLASILFQSLGYYIALLYSSISIMFFLVRNMKLIILPESHEDSIGHGNKRRLYLLLFIAIIQPVFIYWLTAHLTGGPLKTKD
ncbi:protein YIF1B-like isoform X1 [Patiria miniata]|uniref:Protein YIF1 n=1 Tax=Patiria miniata TaxID=46514 RepID=A0A913Z3R2_PATMI|nr:protein YIF1B-like isoform X1 [Patiria miniata]